MPTCKINNVADLKWLTKHRADANAAAIDPGEKSKRGQQLPEQYHSDTLFILSYRAIRDGIRVIYRIVKGRLRLNEGKEMHPQ